MRQGVGVTVTEKLVNRLVRASSLASAEHRLASLGAVVCIW